MNWILSDLKLEKRYSVPPRHKHPFQGQSCYHQPPSQPPLSSWYLKIFQKSVLSVFGFSHPSLREKSGTASRDSLVIWEFTQQSSHGGPLAVSQTLPGGSQGKTHCIRKLKHCLPSGCVAICTEGEKQWRVNQWCLSTDQGTKLSSSHCILSHHTVTERKDTKVHISKSLIRKS